jgi:tetratricopeptide (TPR) repeat protein
VELNPGYGNAHVNLGIALLKSGQIGDAISELKIAAGMSSEDALIHFALGNALCAGQRLPEAIAEYERAIDLDPSSFEMHDRLGTALVQAGRIDDAVAHFIKLQEQCPKDPEPSSFLGNVFVQTGRNREAVEQYERALQRSPSNLVALNNLSLVLSSGSDVSIRDPARGLALAQQLDEISGGNDSTYVSTLAAAYVASGYIAKASEAAERAAQIASEQGLASVAASLHQRALALKKQTPDNSKR